MKKILITVALILLFAVPVGAYTLANPSEDSLYAWDDSANVPMWVPYTDFLTSASISDTVYGSGWNADTTHAASKNAIYDKIESLSGGHDAVTLASGVNTLTLSTQEIGVDATVEQLADLTAVNDAIIGYNGSGALEAKSSLDIDVILSTGISTAGSIGRSTDKITLRNNANGATLSFSDDSAIAAASTITASGFDGNLATTDDTLQEVAQALDDLSTGSAPTAATAANINTGTSTTLMNTPDAIAGSHIGEKEAGWTIYDSDTVTAVADGNRHL